MLVKAAWHVMPSTAAPTSQLSVLFGTKLLVQFRTCRCYTIASGTVQVLAQTGIQTLRSTLIAGGQGNDSVYLGDQISTFDKVSTEVVLVMTFLPTTLVPIQLVISLNSPVVR